MLASLVLFLVCVFAVVHPYSTYPLSLGVLRAIRGRKPIGCSGPEPKTFAIVCCAYNEVKVIESKIDNLLQLREKLGDCQILVHSDGSHDGTNDILKKYENVITVSIATKRGGKSAGMNCLMSMVDAEVVIFTDANVMVDVDKIVNIKRYFKDPEIGCVTGRLLYVNRGESDTAKMGTIYRGFEEGLKQLESDTGTVVYTDGTLFAIRRNIFRTVPADITDDLHTGLTVITSGYRNVAADDFVAYEHAASTRKDEFRRRVRIGCRTFNCNRLFWPRIVKLDGLTFYKYLSHKVLRWVSGFFLVGGFLAGVEIAFFLYGAVGALTYIAVAASAGWVGLRQSVPLLSTAVEGAIATLATTYGVFLSLRGERFQTWTIASSSRK
jgi:cellulose synthase/poly-beta-1,6-N-acetylglucosamine synthase-like glycosyltransferase